MPRQRRTCPICQKKGLIKLSNHLADVHQLESDDRRIILKKAKEMNDQSNTYYDAERTLKPLLEQIIAMQTIILSKLQSRGTERSGDRWETMTW